MSLGLRRVRATVNATSSPAVAAIKAQAAGIIDLIDTIPAEGEEAAEIARLKALAQTAVEQGAMWAVKAATA